jgi:hypothetical protein
MGIVCQVSVAHILQGFAKLGDIYGNCAAGKCGSHSAEIRKAGGYIWELCGR